ncbi:MAG: DnaA regulatory inactivator Hda [Rubrivivax sp.]|nr:DnaA regulatory inactivator Hda [Rubrivivax sp.]
MRQLPLALGPAPDCTFDSFLPGANAAALQHLRTLGASAAPVYLWGPSGCGKTHLLRALAARVQGAGGVVGSFEAGMAFPWSLGAGWSLVIVDRCDELSEEAQRAAFALFEDAAAEGVAFAAAGRLPPVDLPLRDDLRTRLGWGHVFALAPLTEPETRAALRREADRRGIFLGDEVMGHLLTHCPRDLTSLMQLIDRLDDFSMSKSRHVTVPLLRQMLAEEGDSANEPGRVTAEGRASDGPGTDPVDERPSP